LGLQWVTIVEGEFSQLQMSLSLSLVLFLSLLELQQTEERQRERRLRTKDGMIKREWEEEIIGAETKI
jgi:hypothetical protein